MRAKLRAAMPGLKERAKTLIELLDGAKFLFAERPLAVDVKAASILDAGGRAHIARMIRVWRRSKIGTPPVSKLWCACIALKPQSSSATPRSRCAPRSLGGRRRREFSMFWKSWLRGKPRPPARPGLVRVVRCPASPAAEEHDHFWPKARRGAWSHKLLAAEMLRATSGQRLEWVMSQNRVFDDFARLAPDASEVAQGVRREAETAMKSYSIVSRDDGCRHPRGIRGG